MGYLTRIAAWISQGINCVLLGGHHDQTVSARCYVNRYSPRWRIAYNAINRIFFWQENHCFSSYMADVDFAKQVLNERV